MAHRALLCRELVLQLISADASAPASLAPALLPLGPEAWRIVLERERCAMTLRARLRQIAGSSEGADLPPVVEERARLEAQRALAAWRQILELGQLARAHKIRGVVLKGGLSALGPTPVDLDDIDLLVEEQHAEHLATLLTTLGYTRSGERIVAHHLAQRARPDALPVEIHVALPGLEGWRESWERIEPLAAAPGLWRLAPSDHLWHLLVHATISHPYRRGCVRDLLLTGAAVAECADDALEAIAGRVRASPYRVPQDGMLSMARELVAGTRVRDRFPAEAAANYLLLDHARWLRPWQRLTQMGTVFALLGGPIDRKAEWTAARAPAPFPSSWRLLASLEHRWPPVGAACRRALRLTRLALARLTFWPVARRALQLAQRVEASRYGAPMRAAEPSRAASDASGGSTVVTP